MLSSCVSHVNWYHALPLLYFSLGCRGEPVNETTLYKLRLCHSINWSKFYQAIVLSDIPSPSSIMVTVKVSGEVMLPGLGTDAVMVKVSSPSSTISPSMVMGWHTGVVPSTIPGRMMIWLDCSWTSSVSEANKYTCMHGYNHAIKYDLDDIQTNKV